MLIKCYFSNSPISIRGTMEEYYMQEYRNRIRELREEKHITQVRLSTELGVAQETISAYEQGRHLPSVTSLMKLSVILDASMDYIMMKSDVRNVVQVKSLMKQDFSDIIKSLTHQVKKKHFHTSKALMTD